MLLEPKSSVEFDFLYLRGAKIDNEIQNVQGSDLKELAHTRSLISLFIDDFLWTKQCKFCSTIATCSGVRNYVFNGNFEIRSIALKPLVGITQKCEHYFSSSAHAVTYNWTCLENKSLEGISGNYFCANVQCGYDINSNSSFRIPYRDWLRLKRLLLHKRSQLLNKIAVWRLNVWTEIRLTVPWDRDSLWLA